MWPVMHAGTETPPPPWTESQTGVKTLPCPKLCLRAVNICVCMGACRDNQSKSFDIDLRNVCLFQRSIRENSFIQRRPRYWTDWHCTDEKIKKGTDLYFVVFFFSSELGVTLPQDMSGSWDGFDGHLYFKQSIFGFYYNRWFPFFRLWILNGKKSFYFAWMCKTISCCLKYLMKIEWWVHLFKSN